MVWQRGMHIYTGLSEWRGKGRSPPPPPHILSDQLTRGADYDQHITTRTPGFSDLPTALLQGERKSI